MPDPYTLLGVPLEATDDAIRKRYLELVKQYPPEQQPEMFAKIREAYDALKDLEARTMYRLYEYGKNETIESIIEEAACRTSRRRIGLNTLVSAATPPR